MYGYESWTIKKAGCKRIDSFWTVVLEKTLESPLDSKEIQLVHPKEDQSWVFIGRNDVEAKIPILWPSEVKNWLIWKDPDVGKDWRQEEKGMTKDKMVGWNHWLNGHEFEYIPGAGDGQGGLVCCSPWRRQELDLTEWLNWAEGPTNPFGNSFGFLCLWPFLFCKQVHLYHIFKFLTCHTIWHFSFSLY